MLQQVPHPIVGHTTQIGVVPRLSDTPGSIRQTGPDAGANGRDVLEQELGIAPEALDALVRAGAVRL